MRRTVPWLGVVALFGILLPAFAADDSDPKTKPDPKNQKQYDKLTKPGSSFPGKLVKIDTDQRRLTVQVSYKVLKQDPQAAQRLQNLQIQLVEAQRHRNPVERIAQTNRIQLDIEKAKLNLYKDETQKIEFDAPDNMKVRTLVLPIEVDEKGKPRKLTDKEKKELKGPDPTLPGYTGDFDSLKVDQMVLVYVAKQPAKSKTKDSDADSTDSTRPKIAMIVIQAEWKN